MKKHIIQKKQGDLSLLLSIIVERCLFYLFEITTFGNSIATIMEQTFTCFEWYCMKVMDMPRFYNTYGQGKCMTIFFQVGLKMLKFRYFSSFLACKGIQFS